MTRFGFILVLIVLLFPEVSSSQEKKYKTENVIVLIMDGPRYTETWGDPTHQYIPRLANDMLPHGSFYPNFRNNGPTYTAAGHTAICTGIYQGIDNTGLEFPKHPSMFQYWLKAKGKASNKAFVIASKDKLVILTDCKKKEWKGKFRPYSDCGINGLYTGYRSDEVTYQRSVKIFTEDKPNLVLINFKQPDAWAHAGNWEKYLQTMKETDEYIYKLYQLLTTDPNYAGKTTIFVTNDHGRHPDGHKDGFISHGDNCEGCRKILCWAYGPDFVKGKIFTDITREQIDIPVTIGHLLGFTIEGSNGQVLTELFE